MRPKSRVFIIVLKAVFFAIVLATGLQGAVTSVTVTSDRATVIHGQSAQFTAVVNFTGSPAPSPAVTWSFSPTIGTLSATGLYTAPASVFQDRNITVTATSVADPTKFGSATILLMATVGISLSPTTVTLTDGQTQQFTATVTGTTNTAVTWSISPENAGFITADGFYTAPSQILSRQSVTVAVVSVSDPTQVATATITLQPAAAPPGVTVAPASATIRPGGSQQFTATVIGLSSTLVTWSISPIIGTISSTGLYTAPATINSTQSVTVTARSIVDSTKSGSATITLAPFPLVITPDTVTLKTGATQQFTVTSNNLPFTDVTWSLGADFGTISSTGLYTAPAYAPIRLTFQVIATANGDPSRSGAATVIISASAITVTPATVSLTNGGTQQFVFNIDGAAVADPAKDVMWSLAPAVGTITPAGLYTAPPAISTAQSVTLTGTYLPDPAKTAKATINLAVFIDVGHGAPNPAITSQFVSNYYRNGFNFLVSLPPLGDVKRLGAAGYVQEFSDAKGVGKYALVKPNADPIAQNILQVYPDVYAYYNSVGVNTAGYPTMDTANCPAFDAANSCSYSLFDKNYALFVYKIPVFASQTQFAIRNAFYTKWSAVGGLNGPGRPIDIEISVTGTGGTTATQQTYSNGAIYTITNGANNGKTFAVLGSTYKQYLVQGGPTGALGLPTGDEFVQANGDHRQTFQGGAIQFTPGTDPVLRLPVNSVALQGFSGNPLKMTAGDTVTLTAKAYSTTGIELTGRSIVWSTTNGQVTTIQSGQGSPSAVIQAIAGGLAVIHASSEGVISAGLSISVTAPCCQIGEGSPTSIIQQAFQNAVTRNRLSIKLPAANPVQRSGAGYMQQLQSAADGSTILLAKSDRAPAAYPVSGELLSRYQQLGGTTGSLGYPTADPTAGGTQFFENNTALAGKPVRLVSGLIFRKWGILANDTGAAGPPAGDASSFRTIGANAGDQQAFRGGVIYGATSGPRTGQAYLVGGLILERFNALGGAAGAFGMPVSDEFASANVRRQDFEGGYMDYALGDAIAREHAAVQRPAVTANPGSVLAGSRVRLTIAGFQTNATIRVSITGQPDFVVTAGNGAYSWEAYIPLTARAATVNVHAVDTKTGDAADASYNIMSLATNRAQLAKMQGDLQTGLPGAVLAQALRVVLRDASGNPVIGAPVAFQASPGAQIVQAFPATDASGQAEAVVRLPASEGVALVTADSPGIATSAVTFSVMATASSLPGFPKLLQPATQKSALLTAAASILRYHQNRGDLPAPNGLADATTLNQYLKAFCAVDAQGKQVCDGFLVNPDSGEQVTNLWRVGGFAGGAVDVSVEKADTAAVRDLVGQGSPVLLALMLSADGQPAGGHYVVAIGVGPQGELLIHDPSANFAQSRLDDYLVGFTAGAHFWKAELISAVRFLLRSPLNTRFLLAAVSQPASLLQTLAMDVKSIAGSCGQPLDLPDAADFNAGSAAGTPPVSRFVACDGSQPVYQVSVGAARTYRITATDFANGGGVTDLSGSGPAAYKAIRPAITLALTPQDLTVLANGVVNAATFTAGIAPGGLFSVFGAGLAGPGTQTTVSIDGSAAQVVAATPFQINAQLPPDVAPGPHTLRLQSAFGVFEQPVEIVAHAPAIFVLGDGRGAVVNQDGRINGPTTPLTRGQVLVIYCTGLGAVTRQGTLSGVTDRVTALLGGTELPVSFAGLTPGFVGLYQANVPIPTTTPPGIDLPLGLLQAGEESNTVPVSVQ